MLELTEFPVEGRRQIRGVLTDIDDTLTSEGRLTASAYAALERLFAAGFIVVPVTGRPAGWCDHIARMWPVSAVVGENGAFHMRYDPAARKLHTVFVDDAATRREKRARLATVAEQVQAAVPGCALASDQNYREADIAIDYCEDVPRLSESAVDAIVRLMMDAGLTVKVSSIHVNGWLGDYDKLAMTKRLAREAFGVDLDADKERWVFVGDSPNDVPMFAYFPNSVGVANMRDFASRLEVLPRYVTVGRGGEGFIELAKILLVAR